MGDEGQHETNVPATLAKTEEQAWLPRKAAISRRPQSPSTAADERPEKLGVLKLAEHRLPFLLSSFSRRFLSLHLEVLLQEAVHVLKMGCELLNADLESNLQPRNLRDKA